MTDKNNSFDASDPDQVERQAKKAARFQSERAEVLTNIMSSAAGRAWVYDLLAFCNSFGNPIIPGDTHLTYAHIGMQNVGKMLLDQINTAAPDRYLPMLREARSRENA